MAIEQIVAIVISVLASIVGVVLGLVYEWHNRKSQPCPGRIEYGHFEYRPRKTLTEREKSDLYRDMAWWDREFNKLCGIRKPGNMTSGSEAWADAVRSRVTELEKLQAMTAQRLGYPSADAYKAVLTEREYQDAIMKEISK